MKKFLSLIFLIGFCCLPGVNRIYAQVITLNPPLPTDADAVVITFDAAQGNKGLMDYTGDVYAHTGVLTNLSSSNSNWLYVKADWTVNKPECKMTRISANLYQLTISPSIRTFYGVSASEKILKLAFVFRSGDRSKEGKGDGNADIFADVVEPTLNVAFTKPSNSFTLLSSGSQIPIEINATLADSIQLFDGSTLLKSSKTSPLIHTISASGTQIHTLIAKAFKGTEGVADTCYYMVQAAVQTASLPPGVKDGINYINDSTLTLVLFAPYKSSVFLIGDMNQFLPDNTYLMKKDQNRFWITLNTLEKGKEYRFQYLIDGEIRIADPYCDKILDPWNDSSIPSRIYPGLIPYPAGKTTEAVGVFQTAQPAYEWQITDFDAPPVEKLIIYELLIRDFTSNRDIKTITDTLLYLKRLGINAIELMPFNEFEGNDSWGYNPSFYFAPDKAYGTKNDYKKFIDECHKNGIAVIQDIVLNHSYGQAPLVRMYLENGKPSSQNPWFNITSPNTAYSWGYDFNHESTFTKQFVDRVTRYWMTEYKIDGFRFDFTKGFTNTSGDGWAYDPARISILKRMSDSIRAVKSDAYIMLEHLAENSEEKVLADYGMLLWGNMNYNYNEATMGYHESGKSNFSGISYKTRGWSYPHLVGYMESHDEERLMFKNTSYGNYSGNYDIRFEPIGIKRMELANVFFISVPGPKMIWQFGELGYDFSIDYNGRLGQKPIRWDYYDRLERERLYRIIGLLNELKKTEEVFSTGTFAINFSGSVKSMFLDGSENDIEIVGNFDVTEKNHSITFPATGTWYEYFTRDSIILTSPVHDIVLQPGEYRMYSSKKMTGYGEIHVDVPNNLNEEKGIVFPNPVTHQLNLSFPSGLEKAWIFSSEGRVMGEKILSGKEAFIDCSGLPAGLFYLVLLDQHGNKSWFPFQKIP